MATRTTHTRSSHARAPLTAATNDRPVDVTRDDLARAHALLEGARRRVELLTATGLALMHGGEPLVGDDGPIDVVVLGDALHETAREIAGALGEASTILHV